MTNLDINAYGADPTGQRLSDTAWQEVYAVAQEVCQAESTENNATSGAVITLGCGIYSFSPNVVSISDARIGLLGRGKGATTVRTPGSNGTLVSATGNVSPNSPAAPIGGFWAFGWSAGQNVVGVKIGDRGFGTVADITASGFNAAGGMGFLISNTSSGGIEGVDAVSLDSRNNAVGYCFDGNNVNGTFDYSRWFLHTGGNGVALQVINQAHCWGGMIALVGNAGDPSLFPTSTLVQVGASTSDEAKLYDCHLHIAVEADGGQPVTDFVIQGADQFSGIVDCYGTISLLPASATWTAGSLSGGARFSFYGPIKGSPLVASRANPVLPAFDSRQ